MRIFLQTSHEKVAMRANDVVAWNAGSILMKGSNGSESVRNQFRTSSELVPNHLISRG